MKRGRSPLYKNHPFPSIYMQNLKYSKELGKGRVRAELFFGD
jgi:hypothetical protein